MPTSLTGEKGNSNVKTHQRIPKSTNGDRNSTQSSASSRNDQQTTRPEHAEKEKNQRHIAGKGGGLVAGAEGDAIVVKVRPANKIMYHI